MIAVRFAGAILGNVLMWSGTVLYDRSTRRASASWGIAPLADQSTAGVVMMIEGTFLALGLLAWVFFEAAREGIEKQRLLDLAYDRGVELDRARAQRAVAAGHGARLEEQLPGAGGERRSRARLSGGCCRRSSSSSAPPASASRSPRRACWRPYFGASTIVWANTIGVVLVALSVGYWFGGRFADRHPAPARRSACWSSAASLLIAVVPFAARPFLGFSVDAFDSISVGGFAGSLFGVLVLVAVPVTLLGAASPWAVRLAMGDVDGSGEVVGRLYAISTAGSLVGTMLSALLLIPLLGTQRTFLVFALALALVAARRDRLARGRWCRPRWPWALALPVGTIKGAGDDRVLYEAETTQQYARVVERARRQPRPGAERGPGGPLALPARAPT